MSWECLTIKKKLGGMRFRHLHAFNLSMLGKRSKVENLLYSQMLMVTKMYKAKYFLNQDFLDAKLQFKLYMA